MSTVTVSVSGMSCGHCVTSVREEVGGLAGVTAVEVDLAGGTVTVESVGELEPEAIQNAIEEAGYQLAS
jgi:copper chaperone